MLRIGCIILSVWLVLNLVPSTWILIDTLSGRGHTPAINGLLTVDEVRNLQPDVLATIDSIAVFANGLNMAFCTLALGVVWWGLHRGQRWALWSLSIGFGFAVFAGVGADYIVGTLFPEINLISLAIGGTGLTLAGIPVLRSN